MDLESKVVYQNGRSAVLEIVDGGIYDTKENYELYLNGTSAGKVKTTIHKIFNLEPCTHYLAELKKGNEVISQTNFITDYERVTLNVRDFGAYGDGEHDDTLAIQSAIMACPKQGRVLIPKGYYRFVCLFLKSHVNIELAKGAELSAFTEREKFPVYPGAIPTTDGTDEYHIGSWEGDPGKMFCALITATHVKDVNIYGEGTINGNGNFDNWWQNCRDQVIAWRPRMMFLNHCKKINVMGITVKNSPSWNLHPFFSKRLLFIGLDILSPKDSHNTDGLDPESCKDVEILGVHFSVGDDCIAVKSGKIYMGSKYKTPSENITIRQCSMNDGHGSITLGSEIGAGVKNIRVRECKFTDTDRGLRIKTRRGRGQDSVIQDVIFENIRMDGVGTPFVANSFYFCDFDGKTDYVQARHPLPVDERTPEIKSLYFRNINVTNARHAAAFLYGLPEKKIGVVEFEHVRVSYAEDATEGIPAMMCGVGKMKKAGIMAANVEKLVLKDVEIIGQEGDEIVTEQVDEIVTEQVDEIVCQNLSERSVIV